MPRKISRESALERSITEFWDHGYRGTSMDRLATVLGVAKPSIYANFGCKKALFLEALNAYHTMLMQRVSDVLGKGGSPREGLDRLVCELMTPDRAECRRGSLLTNSALEMVHLDPDLRDYINKSYSDLLDVLGKAIRRGQDEGEVRTDLPEAALAEFLVSSIQGVRVLEKTGVMANHWPATARLVLSVLDSPAGCLDRHPPRRSTASAARKVSSADAYHLASVRR